MIKKITLCLSIMVAIAGNAQLISSTGNMSYARVSHSSATLANGKILVFGGDNGDAQNYVVHSSAELYNNGTWTNTGSMARTRRLAASITLDNGNVMVMGGRDANINETPTCEIYNVATGTWSFADSMSEPRSNSVAIMLDNGKILVIGGDYTQNCELYDPATDSWTQADTLSQFRTDGFGAVKLANGNVLVVGGGSQIAEMYDAQTNTWSELSNQMITQRTAPTAIMMTNGKVLIAGGNFTKTCEVFDPATNSFSATGDMGQYASACDMINLTDGTVLIYGIGDLFSIDRKALQVYNPASGTWSYPGTVGTNIYTASDYTVNKLPNGKILYSGGNFTTGNGSNKQCYIVNLQALGLSENENSNLFSVYPVPAKDFVNVSFDAAAVGKNYNLVLSDALGNIILTTPVIGNMTKVNFDNNVQSGVYFLSLRGTSGKFEHMQRIVVQ